jgi:hypothetical protein
VVPDLEEAIDYCRKTFSIGTLLRIPDFQKLGYEETYYKGESEKFNSTSAFFRLGTMQVKIIQPLFQGLEFGNKGIVRSAKSPRGKVVFHN